MTEVGVAAKAYIGMGMEGAIARWYEKTTVKDMEEFRLLAARIAGTVPAGGAILEIAPGPGFLSVELARRGFSVTGLDISRTFVQLARANAEKAGVAARFERGDVAAIPFADESFDFLVCRAAFKNFADPTGALREMRRVLRRGGRGMIIDMRRDASMDEIDRYVDGLGVSWLDGVFTKFVFRHMLLRRAWTVADMTRMLAEIPFARTGVTTTATGMEISLEA
jgi:ubiquinone/menaquinone biosynthesis C-methylase UbiE